MKTFSAILVFLFFGATAGASVQEGNFNFGSQSYYSNGTISYCQHSLYNPGFRSLSPPERYELRFMRFDGSCDEGFGAGPRNFRGRSYYANQQHHYCQFFSYNSALPEMSPTEANEIFRGVNDGYCAN